MNVHRMQLPREVIVGQNVLSKTGEMCKTLGFSKCVLIVTGPKVKGITSKILDTSLDEANISSDYALVNESTFEYVKLVEEKIRRCKPELILGVGGGKDIDVAKLTSARTGIPFISIPSAASHDGIASSNTSVKGFEKPYSIKAQVPIAVIADIDVISTSPYRLTASGCGDIIAKYSAVRDWKLAHRMVKEYYGDYAANLALMSAKLVMKSHNDIKNMKVGAIRTINQTLGRCKKRVMKGEAARITNKPTRPILVINCFTALWTADLSFLPLAIEINLTMEKLDEIGTTVIMYKKEKTLTKMP